jgi:hypothetical protein
VGQELALADASQIAGQELRVNSCRNFSPLLLGYLSIDNSTDLNTGVSKIACA